MRYVVERYKHEQRETAYRVYVTDSLRALMGNPENRRFAEILKDYSEQTPTVKEKSAQEIIDGIKGKLVRINGGNGV